MGNVEIFIITEWQLRYESTSDNHNGQSCLPQLEFSFKTSMPDKDICWFKPSLILIQLRPINYLN